MKVPENLRWIAERSGPDIKAFVDSLPRRIAELEDLWEIKVGEPYDPGGFSSFTARATRADGEPCVLKLAYEWEPTRCEYDALRAWDREGAVRLLEGEPFTMLLERCEPGVPIWSAADFDTADAELLPILKRLWKPAPAGPPWLKLRDLAGLMAERIATHYELSDKPFDVAHVRFAQRFAHDASEFTGAEFLLHGDFHQENVLSATREPWLVIDPSPIVGDPAYDAAFLATDRAHEMTNAVAASRVAARLDRYAAELELDRGHLAAWALTRSVSISINPVFVNADWMQHRRDLVPILGALIGY